MLKLISKPNLKNQYCNLTFDGGSLLFKIAKFCLYCHSFDNLICYLCQQALVRINSEYMQQRDTQNIETFLTTFISNSWFTVHVYDYDS